MNDTAADAVFTGSIPELYDTLLVPLIFASCADDLARRVAARAPARVLETAAGTGVVTRALARMLPPRCAIVATDLNAPMLERAAAVGTARPVEWRQADAHAAALRRRRLRRRRLPVRRHVLSRPRRAPSPRRGACCGRAARWSSASGTASRTTNSPTSVTAALARRFPDDPPRFLARTPHGYHDRAALARDLAQDGFGAAPAFDTLAGRSRAASARVPAVAYCQGTPLRAEIEARAGAGAGLAAATADCEAALAARFGTGPVDGRIQSIVVVAVRD